MNMTLARMEAVAQGRVWTGRQALSRGLVDGMIGAWSALGPPSGGQLRAQ